MSWPEPTDSALRISVTRESMLAAARRLAAERPDAAVLNFASARNPGGGWLAGARAQEESLARASGLVHCLEAAPLYYEANRAERSCLYTDHQIYSPGVPVRDDAGALFPRPTLATFITSPAAEPGRHRAQRATGAAPGPPHPRAAGSPGAPGGGGPRPSRPGPGGVGLRRLPLLSDSAMVATCTASSWTIPRWAACCEEVVFAILGGRPGQDTFATFQRVLGAGA